MTSAKFQVTIDEIDEETLGPMLGKMPDNVNVQIKLMSRPEIPMVTAAKTTTAPATALAVGGKSDIAAWIHSMPQQFQAKDLVPVIEANGYNGNSISHFLKRALQAKLIEKVPGLFGNKVAYRKVFRR